MTDTPTIEEKAAALSTLLEFMERFANRVKQAATEAGVSLTSDELRDFAEIAAKSATLNGYPDEDEINQVAAWTIQVMLEERSAKS